MDLAVPTNPPNVAGPLLRPEQAATYLGISIASFHRLKAAGQLPSPVRLSARINGYPKSRLDEFIASRGDSSTSDAA